MSISKASSAINAGIIILTCLVGYFVFQLYYAIQNNLDLARNKEIAVQLAGELMESSTLWTSGRAKRPARPAVTWLRARKSRLPI